MIFTSGLRTKTINKLKNAKIYLKIEIFFGRGRVHFPFTFSFGESKGEASVKMGDFRDFFEILDFLRIVLVSFSGILEKFLDLFLDVFGRFLAENSDF